MDKDHPHLLPAHPLRRIDPRIVTRLLELYRSRTAFSALLVGVAVAVIGGAEIGLSLSAGALGVFDAPMLIGLVFAVTSGIVSVLAHRIGRHGDRGGRASLWLASGFLVAVFGGLFAFLLTASNIHTPKLFLVTLLLVSGGLMPLPPRIFVSISGLALSAMVAATWGLRLPGAPIIMSTVFVVASWIASVGMNWLNYRLVYTRHADQLAAEDAVAERDQFLRILAHDLRGPVGVLPGFVSLIRQKAGVEPCGDLATELDVLESTARGIRSLLDNTLLWGKAREGSIKPAREIVDAVAIVQTLTQSLGASAHLKEIDLVTDLPESLPVLTDGELLRAVVRNLADNAIKFTEPGGSVSISGAAEGDDIVIRVRDTGIGMAPEGDQPRRAGTGGERGSGIGLGLVATLAGRIGATVTFQSTPGEGTLAEVSLPSGIPAAPSSDTSRDTPARQATLSRDPPERSSTAPGRV
jgi:signal transduction histidine kinase